MATSKERMQEILACMPGVGDVTARAMMGEYLLYYRGKLFGGVYDGKLLVKSFPSAKQMLSDAAEIVPYPGAKPMLEIKTLDPWKMSVFLEAIYPEIPEKRK